MHDVVEVEEIDDRRLEVGAVVRIDGVVVGEIEDQAGAAVGPAAAAVVGVQIVLGGDVVAAGVGELGACGAVGVVPAEGRGRGVGVVAEQVVSGGVGAVGGQRVDPIVRAAVGRPVVDAHHLAGGGVDPQVQPVGTVDAVDHHAPGQHHATVGQFLVAQLHRNRVAGDAGFGKGDLLGRAALGLDLAQCRQALAQADVLGGAHHRDFGRQGRSGASHLRRQVRNEAVVDVEDAAVGEYVDAEHAVVQGNAVVALHPVEMRGAVVTCAVAVAEFQIGHVQLSELQSIQVGLDEVERDGLGGAGLGRGERTAVPGLVEVDFSGPTRGDQEQAGQDQ